MENMTTEELAEYVKSSGKAFFKIPVIKSDNKFQLDEIRDVISAAEKMIIDVFAYCPELLEQKKFAGDKAKECYDYLHTMHINTLPYSSVIIGVSADEKEKLAGILEGKVEFEEIRDL